MTCLYRLEGKTPIAEYNPVVWGQWFQTATRRVKRDVVDDATVSTVFLAINHALHGNEPLPILFETLVFGGALDGKRERCSTWEEAEIMHEAMLRRVRDPLGQQP